MQRKSLHIRNNSSGSGEFYVKPLLSLKSGAQIRNSLFVYYSSRGGISSIPVKLTGVSSSVFIDNCNLWQCSVAPSSENVILENNVQPFNPEFTDTVYFFTPGGGLAKTAGIGYDAEEYNSGENGKSPSAVNNLVVKILGVKSIGLRWDKAAFAEKVAYYRVYRVPGDTSLFYVNQMSQWDLKIARDSLSSVVDTFSTKATYYIDTAITPGKPYIYVVAAVDSNGNEGSVNIPYPPSISSYIVNSYQYSLKISGSKWHMLSAWGASLMKLAQSDSQIVYKWDNTGADDKLYSHYVQVTEMRPGKGYWFKSARDTTINVNSSALSNLKNMQDTIKCVLTRGVTGWNLVSSPFPFPVNPSWLSAMPAWEWNSDSLGYSRAYELQPWKAYWVNVNSDTVLPWRSTVWPEATSTLTKKSAAASWELRLSLRGKGTWDTENILGIIPKGLARQSATEQLEPPAAFGSAQVYFVKDVLSEGPDSKLSYQYKLSDVVPAQKLEWIVGISPLEKSSVLEIENLGSLPENVYAFWTGKEGTVNLSENNKITIPPHTEDIYGYVVVTSNPGDISVYTSRFALRTPYPNPFRGSTVIEYVIPYNWMDNDIKDRKIRLEIFDIAGRRIRTIVNNNVGAGLHRFTWNGSNDRMQAVPGGFYVIRLQYGELSKTVRAFKIR